MCRRKLNDLAFWNSASKDGVLKLAPVRLDRLTRLHRSPVEDDALRRSVVDGVRGHFPFCCFRNKKLKPVNFTMRSRLFEFLILHTGLGLVKRRFWSDNKTHLVIRRLCPVNDTLAYSTFSLD